MISAKAFKKELGDISREAFAHKSGFLTSEIDEFCDDGVPNEH